MKLRDAFRVMQIAVSKEIPPAWCVRGSWANRQLERASGVIHQARSSGRFELSDLVVLQPAVRRSWQDRWTGDCPICNKRQVHWFPGEGYSVCRCAACESEFSPSLFGGV